MLLLLGHTGPIYSPHIRLFKIVQVSDSKRKACRAIKEACRFFLASKFHVLDLLWKLDCRNAGKIRKLNWQAVTLGIQRQFRVAEHNKLQKLRTRIAVIEIVVPARHGVTMIPDNDGADSHLSDS